MVCILYKLIFICMNNDFYAIDNYLKPWIGDFVFT